MIGAVVGPLMMLALAFSKPGPVRALLKVEADAPERARRPSSLGVSEVQLEPLIRSGVVVREPDGCVWVDRAKARRRSWKIAGSLRSAAEAHAREMFPSADRPEWTPPLPARIAGKKAAPTAVTRKTRVVWPDGMPTSNDAV